MNPIYLEYAPKGFVRKTKDIAKAEEEKVEDAGETKEEVQERQSRQIFVKNLNFDTREEQLQQVF